MNSDILTEWNVYKRDLERTFQRVAHRLAESAAKLERQLAEREARQEQELPRKEGA